MIQEGGRARLRTAVPWLLSAAFAIPAGAGISSPGTTSPADLFDGRRALQVDSILTEPGFDGRRAGSEGGRAVEDWIAAQFAASGLRPASREGTFFQEFPVIGFREKKASLELLDGPFGKVRFLHGDDYTLLLTPGSGDVTAEAVFVGYGIDAPEKGRDDYEGCDLQGKIAVVLRGRPDDGQDWSAEYSRNHTFPAAAKRGALAVLYYQRERPVAGAALSSEAYRPDIPGGYISKRIVELLLRETGFRLDEVQEKLKEDAFPLSSGKRLRFKVRVSGEAVTKARNVLGMLRGDDPVLGTEVVIIGAHHDHIGFDSRKRLYAGANDNASGTSVIVQLARTVHEADWTPRRTVFFVTFSGEEMGLLGSRHLAANLPFDSTRLVAMVNIDMAGHGDGGFGIAGGARLGAPYNTWRAELDSALAASFEDYRLEGGNSDHSSFADRGVPAATSWSRGDHHRYHDFEDRSRYILPENLEAVGRGIGSLVTMIADYPEPLADGYGWERTLRAEAMQIAFGPLDGDELVAPDHTTLDGEGRISGRLVALDQTESSAAQILRRLGKLSELPDTRPWIHLARNLGGIEEAWSQLDVALLPVIRIESLEQLGWEGTQALCAAGLAGVIWREGDSAPPPETSAVLSRAGCFLVTDAGTDWLALLTREDDLRILVRPRREDRLPDPPDTLQRSRALLVLSAEGTSDSTWIREALELWGETHLHLDLTEGLEKGVEDRESLRFIAWLRREKWTDRRIRAVLGGNLRDF